MGVKPPFIFRLGRRKVIKEFRIIKALVFQLPCKRNQLGVMCSVVQPVYWNQAFKPTELCPIKNRMHSDMLIQAGKGFFQYRYYANVAAAIGIFSKDLAYQHISPYIISLALILGTGAYPSVGFLSVDYRIDIPLCASDKILTL